MNSGVCPNVEQLMDNLFREHYRRLVGLLVARLGPGYLELAEDAVAEAMLKALKVWSYHGVPSVPRAWLLKVARNDLLDRLKRQSTGHKHQKSLVAITEERLREQVMDVNHECEDEELAMMFMACHPLLSNEVRVTLTLKVVSGFSAEEIARALLALPATISQRLVRARRLLAQTEVRFEIPSAEDMAIRLGNVLDVLYLMFSEGHMAYEGDQLLRRDICSEAQRIARLLAQNPTTNSPAVSSLLALMCFVSARFPSRVDRNGELVLLESQDRQRWDRSLMQQGVYWLSKSACGPGLTAFHLEAEIAACHTLAPSFESTDWATLLHLYDRLLRLKPSPIIALNRAIVLEKMAGPAIALETLLNLKSDIALTNYYPFYMTLANIHEKLDQLELARIAYRRVLDCCKNRPVCVRVLDALARLA